MSEYAKTICPCRYPRCEDRDGNPRLTALGMCEGCQKRFRRVLSWIVLDWVNLTVNLPIPQGGKGERRSTQKVYGHPAEWASDTASKIAAVLNETHDSLADELGETPPPHPGITDRIKVRSAWRYLECRIDRLAHTEWGGEAAAEIIDLHNQIRSSLGHNKPRFTLPTPCPQCEMRTVTRTVDTHIDQIDCQYCGWKIKGEHYGLYTRMVLDSIIAADTPKPAK